MQTPQTPVFLSPRSRSQEIHRWARLEAEKISSQDFPLLWRRKRSHFHLFLARREILKITNKHMKTISFSFDLILESFSESFYVYIERKNNIFWLFSRARVILEQRNSVKVLFLYFISKLSVLCSADFFFYNDLQRRQTLFKAILQTRKLFLLSS